MPKHHTQPTHSAHAIQSTRPFKTNETSRHGQLGVVVGPRWRQADGTGAMCASMSVAVQEKALPSILEHADRLERRLDRHPPDQAMVTLHLTADLLLRSFNWARWKLGFRCSWTGRDRWVAWLDRHTGRGQLPGI
jgi:hypothetical protein